MTAYRLQPTFNGISDAMLEAIDVLASGSVTRDEHNFWFESNATQEQIDTLCTEFNLIQIE